MFYFSNLFAMQSIATQLQELVLLNVILYPFLWQAELDKMINGHLALG